MVTRHATTGKAFGVKVSSSSKSELSALCAAQALSRAFAVDVN